MTTTQSRKFEQAIAALTEESIVHTGHATRMSKLASLLRELKAELLEGKVEQMDIVDEISSLTRDEG